MDKFKNTLAGGGIYGLTLGSAFQWNDWVTTSLLWVLMIVAIFAIVKYITEK